ncbi:hypothetical protein LTR16_007844 [Cryomyces antarcticus]|uniref:Uncharacterized protein n=1 Tax=Cryomyces antarcticus TaxID=329879 RepID=A0ABR0M3S4_9PEZI|nr:hypothetical protein LTR16_007844 [Cryomyces antarcticus]
MCGGNRSTITATPTINGSVNTISSMGMVFSSPSVYISFETLYAVDTAGSTVGAPMSSFILPQPANAVSTQCGTYRFGPGSGHGTAMNYADLNYPVPWSAYSCMSKCRPSGLGCKTIWDDFVPILAFPTDAGLTGVNPAAGAACSPVRRLLDGCLTTQSHPYTGFAELLTAAAGGEHGNVSANEPGQSPGTTIIQ